MTYFISYFNFLHVFFRTLPNKYRVNVSKRYYFLWKIISSFSSFRLIFHIWKQGKFHKIISSDHFIVAVLWLKCCSIFYFKGQNRIFYDAKFWNFYFWIPAINVTMTFGLINYFAKSFYFRRRKIYKYRVLLSLWNVCINID